MALPINVKPRIFHVLICVFKETQGKTRNKGGRIIVSASLVRNNRFISFFTNEWTLLHNRFLVCCAFQAYGLLLLQFFITIVIQCLSSRKGTTNKMVILPSTKVQNSNLDETPPNYLIVWSARLKAFFKSLKYAKFKLAKFKMLFQPNCDLFCANIE